MEMKTSYEIRNRSICQEIFLIFYLCTLLTLKCYIHPFNMFKNAVSLGHVNMLTHLSSYVGHGVDV